MIGRGEVDANTKVEEAGKGRVKENEKEKINETNRENGR